MVNFFKFCNHCLGELQGWSGHLSFIFFLKREIKIYAKYFGFSEKIFKGKHIAQFGFP